MKKFNLKKLAQIAIGIYLIMAIAFYFLCGEQLHVKNDVRESVTLSNALGELIKGESVLQSFYVKGDRITELAVQVATYGRENSGHLQIQIWDQGNLLHEEIVDVGTLIDGEFYRINIKEPLNTHPDDKITMMIQSLDGSPGNAITLWTGNTISTGRLNIAKNPILGEDLIFKDQVIKESLCFYVSTETDLIFGQYYWQFTFLVFIILCIYFLYIIRQDKKGNITNIVRFIDSFTKYQFLLQQLVARDFKTKYKRSVLGILWSFLNPLLMMTVQYIIFSTLFKSTITNFAVYLLIGIVCFNFFNEAVTYSLMSIVGNSNLITKVYVPKYIYPISKICSAGINMLFSIIPVIIVLIATKASLSYAMLITPFGIACLMMFSLGIGLILASSMVFFRDTQFLWGIVSLLWMYATPIFYPETIIPENFLVLYKMNPLYHFIRFIRITLINGVSPEPRAYFVCLLAAIIPLVIGIVIFKKTEDKFILNI